MSKPEPPAAPNPVDTARASTSTNVGTAITNAFLNNTNQNTPDGSLRYDNTGSYTWNDPYTGLAVNIPTFTATQTLSPQQQAIQDQTNAAKYNLAGMANAQSSRLSNWLAGNIDLSQAPAAGDPNAISNVPGASTSFDAGGQQQTTFDDTGLANASNIQGSYGPTDNFSSDRQRVEDSLMGRINPQLALEKSHLEQQLADQGIRYGSDAYNNAMMPYNQQANDARFAAIGQAGSEQQRMMDMAAQKAGFQNAAQQQAYTEAQGRGTFANQAQGTQFQQNAAQADFKNAGLAQQLSQAQAGFNASNMSRNQFMNEQYAARNQPINEISSLLSGSQINNPNFVNTPSNQIPTTDVAGLINNRFSQDMDSYKQQSQNYQSLMGGILGMVGGMAKLGMSDRREKEDIDKIATVFAASDEGERKELPIYEYSFKKDPASTRHIGPMAQDVEKVDPKAVANIGGRKYLDHGKVMGSILRAA